MRLSQAIIGTPRRLYFAYGANLNRQEIAERCPHARPVSALTLRDWTLVFRGVADIEPCPGGRVHGALYSLSPRCEDALDFFEAYDAENPALGLYRKVDLVANGVSFFAYVMNASGHEPPDPYYLGIIRQGYRDWRLDSQSLEHALTMAGQETSEKSTSPESGTPRLAI